jgi:hypothetical protein
VPLYPNSEHGRSLIELGHLRLLAEFRPRICVLCPLPRPILSASHSDCGSGSLYRIITPQAPGIQSSRRFQLDILKGRVQAEINLADGVLGNSWPNPHQGAEVVDGGKHHAIDRQLLDLGQ